MPKWFYNVCGKIANIGPQYVQKCRCVKFAQSPRPSASWLDIIKAWQWPAMTPYDSSRKTIFCEHLSDPDRLREKPMGRTLVGYMFTWELQLMNLTPVSWKFVGTRRMPTWLYPEHTFDDRNGNLIYVLFLTFSRAHGECWKSHQIIHAAIISNEYTFRPI